LISSLIYTSQVLCRRVFYDRALVGVVAAWTASDNDCLPYGKSRTRRICGKLYIK
jgi:hypothetical protein